MESILLATIFVSFFTTFIMIPYWIKAAKKQGLTGKDIHKNSTREVAEGGGLIILAGATVGILLYVAIKTFLFNDSAGTIPILALLCVLFISGVVGIVDDLMGWKKGISKKLRIFLILFSAVPLMVINAGQSSMFGIEFGIWYPLLLIPLAIVGTTTTFNFLAGYNGLETGQAILIIGSLSIVTFATGNSWLSILGACFVASLIGFYFFNMNPAKIFPGDVMTYASGAMIGGMAILGNIEKIALFFFIPYALETVLKLRGGLKKESFSNVQLDGSLEPRYNKIYGLEHLSLRILKKLKPSRKVYEQEVVWLIHLFQMVIIVLGLWLFL
jgi:UDP-N-acetylglucosamine--dolichyl-phosphate N-acetylglucosaminephosphotransferase